MDFNFLLLEDDEVDAINVKKAFNNMNISNPLSHVIDGVEGQDFISEQASLPLLILLDLNMPRMNGHEFLSWLRTESPKKFQTVPVVVFTTSNEIVDVKKAYGNLVSGYIVKPISPDKFMETMAAIGNYWSLCEFTLNGN